MATKTFTYKEEKSGKLDKYLESNPVFYRRNYADRVEILTGADIPSEQIVEPQAE